MMLSAIKLNIPILSSSSKSLLLRNNKCSKISQCGRQYRYLSSVQTLQQLETTPYPLPPSSTTSPLPPPPPLPPNKDNNDERKQDTNNNNNNTILRIPVKHSNKKLPYVITDKIELMDMIEYVLKSKEGELFAYQDDKNTFDDAWYIADSTIQKIESLIRGLSYTIPGTIWNRWLPPPNSSNEEQVESNNVIDIIKVQYALIQRIYDEGYAYMSVRTNRLEELKNKGDVNATEMLLLAQQQQQSLFQDLQKEEEKEEFSMNIDDFNDYDNNLETYHNVQEEMYDEKEERIEAEAMIEEEHRKQIVQEQEKKPRHFMHQFALPGPTTSMIDTVLDALAVSSSSSCQIEQTIDDKTKHYVLDTGDFLHNLIITRHMIDGGDTYNTNICTRPTQISFNALIRLASSIPYDDNIDSEELRDYAVSTAFNTFQAMENECTIIERNSATYMYLLDTVTKYMPTSRIKGNIAYGIFHQARYKCLINQSVINSFINANQPSNGNKFDTFIQNKLLNNNYPIKWKRYSRKKQYTPKEDIY